MVLATGKTITMGLNELADSEISEDLSRHELQALYRKLYGDNKQKPPTSSAIATNAPVRLPDYYRGAQRDLYFLNAVRRQADPNPGAESHHATGDLHLPAHVHSGGHPQRILWITAGPAHDYHLVYRQPDLRPGVWVTTLVPSIPQWEYSETYNGIVHSIMAVLVASSAAYLISENVNSYLLCKIKELTNSRYLFVRVITSTVVASAIDSVVFCTLAFYNVLSWDIIKTMILSQFLIKVVYALLGVGPIYATRSLFNRYINTEQAKGNEYAYPKAR